MSVHYVTGNMLDAGVDAVVNPVNCDGVMGKGLALAVKERWPEVFGTYRWACERGQLKVGRVLTVQRPVLPRGGPRYVIMFPTKDQWRRPAQLDYIRDGLEALRVELQDLDIDSVAVPALGCGLGGLHWDDVKPLIEAALGDLDLVGVDVTVYAPQ